MPIDPGFRRLDDIDFMQIQANEAICELIAGGFLTVEQAIGLNRDSRTILGIDFISELIVDGTLTFEQLSEIGIDALLILHHPYVRQSLRDGELTFEDIINEDNWVRLRDGEGVLANVIFRDERGAAPIPVNIDNAQNTHTASVYDSASKSATMLFERYGAQLDGTGMEEIIHEIITWTNTLPADDIVNDAAKRSIERLTEVQYTYTDPVSGVSMRELLALSWLAIHDDVQRQGSLADAKQSYCQGLYEIQRGYNMSETGIDLNDPDDAPICQAGAFNKQIEKLQGIHPDAKIEFITLATAALKLPIVIKEEVNRYLAARTNPTTAASFVNMTAQIKQIEEQGVIVIWEAIKGDVATRMFDEFGSLYKNKDDEGFTGFIDAGQDIDLGQLASFQKALSESEGYREYCSATMKSYRVFSKMTRENLDPNDDKENDTPTLK